MTIRSEQISAPTARQRQYSFLLLLVAGLGGLLYGVDVGIIGGALPYLEATSGLSPAQLSAIVAVEQAAEAGDEEKKALVAIVGGGGGEEIGCGGGCGGRECHGAGLPFAH